MNIKEIKSQFGVETLGFSYLKDQENPKERAIDPATNEPTKWLRHWDDTNRVQIVAHEDTVKLMKTAKNLALKDKGEVISKTSNKAYRLWVVIAYTEDDFVF